jgi:hypothetical protein
MHRFPIEEYLEKKQTKIGDIKDPKLEAEKALYRNKKGEIYTPSAQIMGALIKSATDYRIPGKGKKTFKDAFKSGILIEPDEIIHKIPSWEVDIRPVVINQARVPRARPRFDKWELEFNVTILDERITPAYLKEILTTAGQYIGIGDYRPTYGLFEVVKIEPIKT